MSLANLTIIGERINPGYKSSKLLIDNEDIKGIQDLAIKQVEKGATYLNINVGERALNEPEFMVDIIEHVQNVVSVPLSFDFPNSHVQEACLKAYDLNKSNGALPVVNSISELRWDMLDLLKICPFKVILMASEREENGESIANKTAQEVYETTLRMTEKTLNNPYHKLTTDDIFIDVSVGPVGADTEGLTKMAVEAIKLIGADERLKGLHMSVGLSNISIMLPKEARDGSLLKPQIESAFLTATVPYGLDTIIGTAGRKYELLAEDNLVMKGFSEAMSLGGFDSIMRIQEIYSAA
jgi:cobalamin-dependent methionine synthase I